MGLVHLVTSWGTWGQTHTRPLLFGMAAFLMVALVARACRGKKGLTDSHGSAHWATRREVRKAGLYAAHGVFLGRHLGCVVRSPQGHVLLCGPTGSGKDLTLNFPTTRSWPHSMVIVDVKDQGENYLQCRQSRPGVVYRFAPTLPGSHRLNLLAHIDPTDVGAFREVAIIVESLLAPKFRGVRPSDSGEYFRQRAADALRDVTLHVLQTTPQPCFGDVLMQMTDPGMLLHAMSHSATIAIQVTGKRMLEMRHQAERQFVGIWDTALGALDMFKDPVIAAATSAADFALTDLQYGPEPVTLYLGANAPTELLYLAPLYRAIVQSALHQLTTEPRRHPRPLLWLLNEFPELGYMHILERAPAWVRSYAMRFLIAIQDIGQLSQTYGEETPLWGNCGTKVFHGPANDQTAQRMSAMLGPLTVQSAGLSTQGPWGRQMVSLHESARPLLTEPEVLGMPDDLAIVWAYGCPAPVLIQKCWEGR